MAGKQSILANSRRTFVAAATFSLFTNLLMLVIPVFSLQTYDRVLASRSGQTLAMLTIIAVGALMLQGVLEGIRSRLMVLVGLWLEKSWGPELLERNIRKGPTSAMSGVQSLRDLATVRGFLGGTGIFNLFDTPWVPIYAACMFMLAPPLGWATLAGGVVLFLVTTLSEVFTRKPLQDAGMKFNVQLVRAHDFVRKSEVIEAMGMLPGIKKLWTQDQDQAVDLLGRGWNANAVLSAFARFARLAIQIAVMALGAWLAIDDKLSPGGVVAASILLARALAPVESLVGSWKGFVDARSALDRLDEELKSDPPARTTTRLPTPTGRLTIERVRYEVSGRERPILNDVALELNPGESLGIIGPSAAGKSTLARVILGIQTPTEGRARLDGADLGTWSREDVGRHIGYLPQDIELFPGTVKQNIARMSDDEADDDKVIEAATLAGVHDMILRLPLGYDTDITDCLRNLSGGQRQRVAIARALYGEPKLLILDEPNSNLDAEGENMLLRALIRAREKGVTSIVIAHRARVLMTVDRLLLLKDGRIEMIGPRDEVMARVLPQPQQQPQPQPAHMSTPKEVRQ
jgi:ATP-binding cassette subfamily C protein/ATP-binding cassette subfamily C protein EexD